MTANPTRVIVVAASSDIGTHLVKHHLRRGASVIGTYRRRSRHVEALERAGAAMLAVDLDDEDAVRSLADNAQVAAFSWDAIIFAAGDLEPIGPFFSTDFGRWERSVIVNSTAQLRALHAVFPHRDRSTVAKVIFFAGGGTNGPFDNYSAYCIGKLSLIKMTELLHSECLDLQVSIIGTGWINTKIHRQTLAAGGAAGSNFEKTRQFMNEPSSGASLERVAECVEWCLTAPRDAVGGRNFSLVHDDWTNPAFLTALQSRPDSHKLRRLT